MALTPAYSLRNSADEEMSEIMSRVQKITATDESGQKNDVLIVTIYEDNNFEHPERGTKVTLQLGFQETGLFLIGTYALSKISYTGDTSDDFANLIFKSASTNTSLLQNKTRSFINKSVGFIVDRVAKESGLTARIEPYFYNVLVNKDQNGISNQRLLFDLGQEHDALFKVQNNTLLFSRRAPDTLVHQPEVELPILPINRREVLNYNWEQDDKETFKSVQVYYRITNEDGEEDMAILTVGEGSPSKQLLEVMGSRDEAVQRANAALNQIVRGDINFTLSLEPMFRIPAENKVEVTGFPRDVINRTYIISKVVYSYQKQGDLTASYTLVNNIKGDKSNPQIQKVLDPEDESLFGVE